eukprot:scaffold1739_cov242-Pinguiococcus_pyrenoidosus.AAC.3
MPGISDLGCCHVHSIGAPPLHNPRDLGVIEPVAITVHQPHGEGLASQRLREAVRQRLSRVHLHLLGAVTEAGLHDPKWTGRSILVLTSGYQRHQNRVHGVLPARRSHGRDEVQVARQQLLAQRRRARSCTVLEPGGHVRVDKTPSPSWPEEPHKLLRGHVAMPSEVHQPRQDADVRPVLRKGALWEREHPRGRSQKQAADVAGILHGVLGGKVAPQRMSHKMQVANAHALPPALQRVHEEVDRLPWRS